MSASSASTPSRNLWCPAVGARALVKDPGAAALFIAKCLEGAFCEVRMQETRGANPEPSAHPEKAALVRPGVQASCHSDGWIFAILDAAWLLIPVATRRRDYPDVGTIHRGFIAGG